MLCKMFCKNFNWKIDENLHKSFPRQVFLSVLIWLYLLGPCRLCSPGSFSNTTGAGECRCCPAGYESTHMKNGCKRCELREFSTGECTMCQTCGRGGCKLFFYLEIS